jgi:hypothetical protein
LSRSASAGAVVEPVADFPKSTAGTWGVKSEVGSPKMRDASDEGANAGNNAAYQKGTRSRVGCGHTHRRIPRSRMNQGNADLVR